MKHLLFALILSFSFLMSCVSRTNNDNKIGQTNDIINKINERLINKDCSSVLSVIPKNEINSPDFVVFIYNIFDCDDCIKAGFRVTKSIDDLFSYQKVFVVSIMDNTSVQQTKYEYFNYIYNDENDTIRKQLKYVPTPIIIHVDSNLKIKNLLRPDQQNVYEQREFIKNFLNGH